MSNELRQQFKSLQHHPHAGAADSAWLTSSKDVLRMQIKNTVSVGVIKRVPLRSKARAFMSWYVFGGRPYAIALRVTAAMLAIVLIPFTGWVSSVNAALLSVSGEPLYNLKIATERVQLSLAADKRTEIKLRTEFAARRADEIVKLSTNSKNHDAKPHIEATVKRLSAEIATVKTTFADLHNNSEPQEVIDVARTVDSRAEEISKVLSKTSDVDGVSPEIREVKALVDTVSVQAVETLVKSNKDVDAGLVTSKEIKHTIEEKLKSAEVQLEVAVLTIGVSTPENKAEIKKIEEQVQSAKDVVEKATASVKIEDFEEALDKVREVQTIINSTEKNIAAVIRPSETPRMVEDVKVTNTTTPTTVTQPSTTIKSSEPMLKAQDLETDSVTNTAIQRLIQQEDSQRAMQIVDEVIIE